jgi:hypothetical protein
VLVGRSPVPFFPLFIYQGVYKSSLSRLCPSQRHPLQENVLDIDITPISLADPPSGDAIKHHPAPRL